ncbi:glycosyltransferase family 1 protein [Hankyongella ginsenosidimutans]|uniref:Glycosyltransferase family 1 protein n=1 Tax=Hankyongella ginsenosidimutans TaxID=1763828 RepID=A0A4D7CAM9_9SPHN|nr:glycosyltransferase family 1 protein [Hankyongella ginsenosidimutans]QCI80503.1 glycosyltransferase family 1 protein [Hankyongella ginsenosidimutans]
MFPPGLRVALFSGNYNYVRDGANQSLNRLVAFLERHGVPVRVYSPTIDPPAFPPTGTLISVPSVPVPRRPEYRIALGLPAKIRRDVEAFAPTLIHLSAPDLLGWGALALAERLRIPAVASFHTRFETYLRYYGLGWLEPFVIARLRRFYGRCQAVLAPSESMAAEIHAQRLSENVRIWSRGVDRALYNPDRRDLGWRRGLGIDDAEPVVAFVGRLVLEKGLEAFAGTLDALRAQDVPHRALVVGDGPERAWMQQRLPSAVFAGFQTGEALARAYASSDIFLNPSVTETFGNVTLEAMASGVPAVCADATGARSLVRHGTTGFLVPPREPDGFVAPVRQLLTEPALRADMAAASVAASADFTWDAIMLGVVDAYRDALAA